MKKRTLFFVALLGILLFVVNAASAVSPTVDVATDKDTYLPGETVKVTTDVSDVPYVGYQGAVKITHAITSEGIFQEYVVTGTNPFTHTGYLTAPDQEKPYTIKTIYYWNETSGQKVKEKDTHINTQFIVGVPEFSSIAIPVAAVMMIMFVMQRRKRE